MLYLIPQPESIQSPHDSDAEGKVRLQHGAKDKGLEIQWTKFSREHPALHVLLADSSLFVFCHFIENTNAPSPTPVGINTANPINHNYCPLEALGDLEKWKGSFKCWNGKTFDHKAQVLFHSMTKSNKTKGARYILSLNKPQPVMVLTTFTFSTRGYLTAIYSIMGRVPTSS